MAAQYHKPASEPSSRGAKRNNPRTTVVLAQLNQRTCTTGNYIVIIRDGRNYYLGGQEVM